MLKKVIKESVLNVCVRINRVQKSKQIYYVYIILWMTVRSDSLSNMDDIDKLLSELDLPTVSASPTLLKNSQRKSRDIDDLLDLTADTSKMKVQSQTFNRKASPDLSAPLILGGSACSLGRGSLARNVASERVRCLNCDFIVERFEDAEWDSSATYLFFRNTAPDRKKMAKMLRCKIGSAAYACQCSWYTATKPEPARLGYKNLKWTADD